LDEAKFLFYLDLVHKVAEAIEKHLADTFVGAYETILFYHRWDRVYPMGHKTEAHALVEHIAANLNDHAVGVEYAAGLIAHYNKA
jgi:hypothetical protein